MRPLRQTLKLILKLLAALAGIAVLSFLAYDLLVFQPRRAEIAAIVAHADLRERRPPAMLGQLMRLDSHDRIAMLATRQILFDLDVAPRGAVAWVRTNMLWWLLVRVHLTEDERFTIVCSRSWFGQGTRGFQSAALRVFSRDLDKLNPLELAKLVVLARWPSYFGAPEHAADLERFGESLLAQAGEPALDAARVME